MILCVNTVHSYFIVILKLYIPLAVPAASLALKSYLKDRRKTLMDKEREYTPNSFWIAYISSSLISHHLTMIVLETESCLISSFIYVFVCICWPLTLGKRTKDGDIEVLCVECSVVWCRDMETTTDRAKTTGSIWEVNMEKDGACKMDRQIKKNAVVLERVGEGRIMLELIRKRKRNWLGHWLRRTRCWRML